MQDSTSALEEQLARMAHVSDDAWMSTLSDRKIRELEFHDRDRDREQAAELDQDTYERFYGNRKYYSATEDSREYRERWIRENARGKVFLDYACGNGSQAILAAQSGAKLAIGIDISSVSVQNAAHDAQVAGVEANTRFVQADCENTTLPDNSVDVIICSGMLHHLDLSFAFPELRRILKPGGKLLALEALDYNPAIKMYRKITPEMRTEWEKAHILSFRDVRFARRFFTLGEVRYWHILAILAPHLPAFMSGILTRLDRVLTRIPWVQRMSWMFTFELIKDPTPSEHVASGR